MDPTEYTPEQIQEMREIDTEMRAKLERERSKDTSRTYKGGANNWTNWCQEEGLADVINIYSITKFMNYLESAATVAHGTRPPAFSTFQGYINGLMDLYNKRLAEGTMLAFAPDFWRIPVIRNTKKVLKLREDKFLAEHPNTALVKVFTSVHQAAAMKLSSLVSPGLGLLARLFLTWGTANSLRKSDFFQLRWHSAVLQPHPCWEDEIFIKPDEIGPHQANSVIIPSSLRKHGNGSITASGSVRWRDIELCPQHHLACCAAFTFGRLPGRLTAKNQKGFIACAPSRTNNRPMADSYWNLIINKIFRPAGVPIDNPIEGRKNTLNHHVRRYGINAKDISNLPYELIQAGAHHTHDCTRESYLPISCQDLFHTAGFRGEFQKTHVLHRSLAIVTEEMREIVINGLSTIRDNPPTKFMELRDTILVLDYERMVLCQDIPLLPPDDFEQLFIYLPHLRALLDLEYWDSFCQEVRALHAKDIAQRRRELEGNHTSLALTEQVADLDKKLDALLSAVRNPAPSPLALPPPPQPTPPPQKPVDKPLDFNAQGMDGIKEIWEASNYAQKLMDKGGFKWVDGANARQSNFRRGLGEEIKLRVGRLGSVEAAIHELEIEREEFEESDKQSDKSKGRKRDLASFRKKYELEWKEKRRRVSAITQS